jgi:hypothetical protein
MKKMPQTESGYFGRLWLLIEPFVNELIASSFVILAFELVRRITVPFIDPQSVETTEVIRKFVLISTLGAFAFHTVTLILLRGLLAILREGKQGYQELREREKIKNQLNSKPNNFDDADDIKVKAKDPIKGKRREYEKEDQNIS